MTKSTNVSSANRLRDHVSVTHETYLFMSQPSKTRTYKANAQNQIIYHFIYARYHLTI